MNQHALTLFMICALLLFTSCANRAMQKPPVNPSINARITTPFEQLSSKTEGKKTFEDEGKFILIEGNKCIQQDRGEEAATLLAWIEMPGYVDKGTVVLNGWDLRYLHKHHELNSISADITHSKLIKNADSALLIFEAKGKLHDQHRSDAYEFCVFYSVFGYHSAWIDATIEDDYNGIDTALLQTKNQGAVATLENRGNKGLLKGNDEIVIIPRGFDFQFDEIFECELRFLPCKWADSTDYRLLQVAYNLSQNSTSLSQDGSPNWVTQTIFKDNNVRAYRIKTRTALIRGTSVKLRADFLAMNARSKKASPCRKSGGGIIRTKSFRINDLPYDYAVPILTGWDLSFECGHHQVQRAGIWIHDIHFDSISSRLEYKVSSILRDQDSIPNFNAEHRITVFGLNKLQPSDQHRAPAINVKIREQ